MSARPIDRALPVALLFCELLKKYQVPLPLAEFRFSMERQWRFDWGWPTYLVALEVEGGAWTRGRHTRGKGFLEDCVKYSEAAALGWRLLRVPPDQLLTLDTVHLIRRALAFVPPAYMTSDDPPPPWAA